MRKIAFVLVAACGAAPDRPLLANVPHPPASAVAGGAATAAAAITLASPDSANPEKKKPQEDKKPVTVKENVPPAVLDRLDKQPAAKPAAAQKQPQPAGAQTDERPPKDALDFSH
jgi:hypothetical protein